MIKGLSTGISITQSAPAEPEPRAAVEETPATPAEPAVQAQNLNSAGKTALKAEAMFSASAQQASLLKQVEMKPPQASITDGQPTPTRWIGWGGSSEPRLVREANRDASLTPGPGWRDAARDPKVVNQLGLKDQAKAYHLLPKTLNTGDGNDQADIRMGSDNRVHINVNGKEAWAGSTREFAALTINTGGGNDVVNNKVDGAKINTGSGDDKVVNNSYGSLIETGDGNNQVESYGSSNEIVGGSGNDTIRSEGDGNRIVTADGYDTVKSTGDNNYINTGSGNDDVHVEGSYNTIRTEDGEDVVNIHDQYTDGKVVDGYYERGKHITSIRNNVDTGDGIDMVNNSGYETSINVGAGNDRVDNSGENVKIIGGEGHDWVFNTGKSAKIDTGDGNDYVNNRGGSGTVIKTGEGQDTVWITENQDETSPGDPYWNAPDGLKHSVEAITVETGDGRDAVTNADGSRVIVDGEPK